MICELDSCYKFNDARILVAIFKEYQFYIYSQTIWQKDMFNQR